MLYDEPKYLEWNEIQKGDIFETEYGDYGNFVRVVFEKNKITSSGGWLITIGKYLNSNEEFNGYEPIYHNRVSKYKVIGRSDDV